MALKEEAFERIITSVGRGQLSPEELESLYGPWATKEELLRKMVQNDDVRE